MFGVGTFAQAPFAAEGGAIDAFVSVTGVSASGSAGAVVTGISTMPNPVTAQASLGNVTVTASYIASITGFDLDAQLGSVTAYLNVNVPVTGFDLTATLANVSTNANATVSVTGFSLTTQLGEEEVFTEKFVYPTGVYGTVSLGSVEIDGKATVYLTGVSANCRLSTQRVVNVWGLINTTQTANWNQIPT